MITQLAHILTFSLALMLALPAFSLLLLCLLATRGPVALPAGSGRRPRTAVLIAAHNEALHIEATVLALREQLGDEDGLLVVADNCSDATAVIAARAGARVSERHDPARRGKGYALAHGIEVLRASPPELVLIVDADCHLSAGAMERIARCCVASRRPVQMLDLMQAPAGAALGLRIAEFAMRVKNLVRPLGSARLGGACHLMGTGMALPWQLAASAPFATGHIAEDMRLGVDLCSAGHAPLFLPDVCVSSRFSADLAATRVQKSRWEHGHLQTMQEQLPRLALATLRRGGRAALALALDLCIPPLALYTAGLALVSVGAVALTSLGVASLVPAIAVLGAANTAFLLALLLCWRGWGRDLLSAKDLLRLPLYIGWKLPIYLSYLVGKRSGWIRARRAHEATEKSR